MAIKHKRKNSSGYTWQSGDLAEGQIGLNIADGTLHFKKSDNSVVTVDPEAAGGITDVVSDTTPQLGGDLDVAGNAIVSIDNGNIEITPNGTGQINLGLTNLTAYKETIHNGGSASSEYTPNYSNGSVHTVTLTGNVTFAAPTNMPVGASLTLILTQDGTGGKTGTWNASYKWMGGTPILSLANGAIDVINIFYDGTNYISGASKQESSAGGASDLSDLGDVAITSPDDGHALLYNATSSDWENTLLNLDALSGVQISTPSTGQVLTYTMSGQWENQNAPSGGIASVSADTNPALGGNLDLADYEITNTLGNISIVTAEGSSNIYLDVDSGKVIAKSLNYNEFVYALGTTSGTITPNVANGNVQTITLNGNLTFSAFTSPVAGQSLTLIVNTGGTSRTLTSTMKFAGGEKTLSITDTTDIISVFYDGTNYWASLAKGFA
jgi:hypothetical protein